MHPPFLSALYVATLTSSPKSAARQYASSAVDPAYHRPCKQGALHASRQFVACRAVGLAKAGPLRFTFFSAFIRRSALPETDHRGY
jgi:hypothetical protein